MNSSVAILKHWPKMSAGARRTIVLGPLSLSDLKSSYIFVRDGGASATTYCWNNQCAYLLTDGMPRGNTDNNCSNWMGWNISSVSNLIERPSTNEQGVDLTGRNTTGPPCSVTDPDRRRQTPESKTLLAHRRVSNNVQRTYPTRSRAAYYC